MLVIHNLFSKKVVKMELKKRIRENLKKLKNEYGVISIKSEFEAEGSRKDELIMLRELVQSANLGFIIKIGGCEAVHDIDQCKLLSATGIIAPMVESPFAVKKFQGAIEKVYGSNKEIERIINAESITGLNNHDKILDAGAGFLTGVTVGRNDLAASMGIDKTDIEKNEVSEVTRILCESAKRRGLVTSIGGNIGVETIPFLIEMFPFLDYFVTRKVVIPNNKNAVFLKSAIAVALEFELQYLQFKSGYYASMANEDVQKIKRLQTQIANIN